MNKFTIKLLMFIGGVSVLSADPQVHSKCHPNNQCMVPCSKYLHDECGTIFFVSGEYLLFAVKQDSLQTLLGKYNWFYDGLSPITSDRIFDQTGVIYPKMKVTSGFKVGLGIAFEDDGWDSHIRYTWINTRTNAMNPTYSYGTNLGSLFGNLDPLVVPAWRFNYESFDGILNDLNNWVTSTNSKWDIQWNRFDWIVAKSFCVNRFCLRQFLGLVGWWEYQRLFIDYFINGSRNILPLEYNFASVRAYQTAGGVGPYLGGELEFILSGQVKCNYFSFFMQNGISLLWSYFDAYWTVDKQLVTGADIASDAVVVNAKNAYWTNCPMLELLWGLRYTSMSTEGGLGFSLQVGWELQAWFDHFHAFNTFYLTGAGTSNSLFTMQGLAVRLTLII